MNAQRRFGFAEATTGAESVLDDDDIDVVFIATRHHSHAELTCRALEQGKAVFVEKPLALSVNELDRVLEVVARTGNDRLMVGFNRRFAPLLTGMKSRFSPDSTPGSARYLVNAGRLDHRSWYANENLEGSRFVGEGGHFIDTLSWWFDARPTEVHAVPGRHSDDVHATLRFDDGSVATVDYVTDGSSRFPKETFDAIGGGRSARLDNFKTATVWSGRRRSVQRAIDTHRQGPAERARLLPRCGSARRTQCRSRSRRSSPRRAPPSPSPAASLRDEPRRRDARPSPLVCRTRATHVSRRSNDACSRPSAPAGVAAPTRASRPDRRAGTGPTTAALHDDARPCARAGDPCTSACRARRCGRAVVQWALGHVRHRASRSRRARLVPRPGDGAACPERPLRVPRSDIAPKPRPAT